MNRAMPVLAASAALLIAAGSGPVLAQEPALAVSREAAPVPLAGRAAVLDGDTLRLRGQVIGLYGIVAPAPGAVCEGASGGQTRCGIESMRALAAHIDGRPLACEPRGGDRFGRTLAVCRLGEEDLAAWMVAGGRAVADRFHARDYAVLERQAWGRRRGLWAGVFTDPTERDRGDYSASTRITVRDP